jgi:glycosyltransferase involved in cell wall biosynthesis
MSRVSVVITSHNYGCFLGGAIESVLRQTYEGTELIVVDDGSTDETGEVAARYPGILYLRQENRGPGAAKNRGLQAASGEFVIFLDADDELFPDAVDSFVRCLHKRPDCAFAYGHYQFIDGDGALITSRPRRDARFQACIEDDPYRYMLRSNNPLRSSGGVCYRADFLRRVGGLSLELESSTDLDVNLRLAREHPVCCNDQIVLSCRRHSASFSRRGPVRMLRGAIKAQRRQRSYVKQHPVYKQDYREGLRLARRYWGTNLARHALASARAGEVRAALSDLATLGRYAPLSGGLALARLVLGREKASPA